MAANAVGASADYFDFDLVEGIALSPAGDRLAHISDASGRFALWITPIGGGQPLRWDATERASRCYWRPDGKAVLVLADPDGSENYQLAEVAPDTGEVTWLTRQPGVRHQTGIPYGSGTQPYSPDSGSLAYATNARDRRYFDVVVHDPVTGTTRTVLTGEDRYLPMLWSPDGRRLLVHLLHQNIEHDLFVCDVHTGVVTLLTPHEGAAKYLPVAWTSDGTGCYVLTSQGREYVGLAKLTIAEPGRLHWIIAADYDLTGAAVTTDGRRVVWTGGVAGHSRVHVRDLDTGEQRELTCLRDATVAMENGLWGFSLHIDQPGRRMAVQVARATAPTTVHLVDLDTDTATPLVNTAGRVPATAMVEPEIVQVDSTDGVQVPALLFRPPRASAVARVPAVLVIHGGPEVQAVGDYGVYGLYGACQHLLANGIGVLIPNIRGSSGFGMTHQRLIYRDWGGGDLRDLIACTDYLHELAWVDASRLGVCGLSYGGFATLSCLARVDAAWAAGVNIMGPADLLATVRTMPPHWRRRVRDWIGDLDDDADLLRERSPITHAESIRAPLLVITAGNDTRVSAATTDELVATMNRLGRIVEQVHLDDVGHSRGGRADRHRIASLTADWMVRHLARP